MNGLLLRIRSWWETADRTQKAVTVFGSAFLALLLICVFYFASRPRMEIAFHDLTDAEVGSITAEIQKMGIPVDYDVSGKVLVPANKVAEVKAKLALANKLPAGHIGLNITGISAMDSTDVQRLKELDAEQNDLSQTIEAMNGIQKAQVHIAPAQESPFSTEAKPATASVFVTPAPNAFLSQDQGKAIATLVARSVQGLDPAKVQVVDSNGATIFDATNQDSPTGSATEKVRQESVEAARRERDLQTALDQVFGHGATLVKVNLEMDFDQVESTETTNKPNTKPTTSTVQTESMAGGGVAPGGIPGIGSNTGAPTTAAGAKPDDKGYSGSTTQQEFSTNTKNVHMVKQVGAIKSMAVSVMVNTDKITVDPKDAKGSAVGQFVQDWLEPIKKNAANPAAFDYGVTAVKFDTTAADQAKKQADAAAGQNRMQQIVSLLPVAALIVVGFLILKGVSKAAKATPLVAAITGEGGLVPYSPELPSPEDGGAAAPHDFQHEALDQQEILEIEEKVNLPLEQLKKMSSDKPENVAMLIKSWLLEDRR